MESIVVTGSTSAAERSTTRTPSAPQSTITAASSASGTSFASSPRSSPPAPRCSPEAMPGSQRSFCSSEPAAWISRPAAALDRNGTGASAYPSSSIRITSSTTPRPWPPYCSSMKMPGQPSSQSSFQTVVVVLAGIGQLAHPLELDAVGEQVLRGSLDRLLVV